MERTFAIIKPDAVGSGKAGAIFMFPCQVAVNQAIDGVNSPSYDLVEKLRLQCRDPEPAQFFIDGAHGGFGVAGFDQPMQNAPPSFNPNPPAGDGPTGAKPEASPAKPAPKSPAKPKQK